MKNSPNLKQLSRKLQQAFMPVMKRHVFISFLGILGFLIFMIFTINQIISTTTDPEYEASKQADSIRTGFDQKTIEKINQLRSRQENSRLVIPEGRRNPFIE